ncbi:MAG: UDP-N-acetylmuramate dehydrogenase [Acidobacteriota bacterium]
MDRQSFAQDARDLLGPTRLRANEPLAPFTTFRVGGAADWLAEVQTTAELTGVLAAATAAEIPVTLLGGGSNVLVADAGVRGLVIRLRLDDIAQLAPDCVRAGAGVTINGLVRWTIGRGLAALEDWAGTPGTVGGAIHGNAHWRGRNIGDLVRAVTLVAPAGATADVAADAMGFAYDTSRVQSTHEVVIAAEFRVTAGDPAALRQGARASLGYRKQTQPLALASAGCVFRNPDPADDQLPEGMPASAGALIDRAGLKGRRVGGVQISHTHGNFFVSDGLATAAEVRTLIEEARRTVQQRFGITLRDEIVYLGEF